MTTAHSPLSALTAQADNIAKKIKAIDRGEPVDDPSGKIAASIAAGFFKFAVVMDDKLISITMQWSTIHETSEAGLSAFILKHMHNARETVQ
jgi:hypothetical protein